MSAPKIVVTYIIKQKSKQQFQTKYNQLGAKFNQFSNLANNIQSNNVISWSYFLKILFKPRGYIYNLLNHLNIYNNT